MREIVRMGHHAHIFTSDSNHLVPMPAFEGASATEVIDGVEMTWVRTFKYKGVNSLGRIISWLDFEWRLWRLPKRQFRRPDVVIASSLSLLSIFNGLVLRRRFRCRLVFEVRDIWPLALTEEGGFSPRNPFVMALAWVERLAYRRADAIVGTMPNLGEHVSEVVGKSAPVFCIPMGVDEALIEPGEPLSADYAAAHIPQGKFLVCHAGTIGTTNALDTLVDCARAMRDRTDVHFLIVGEGELKPHYEQLSADLPNLTFAPTVPKSTLQALLRRCDLLYFSTYPSKVQRFGQSLNKVIDYMLAGRPIVASYSGFPSMIDESGGGTFVPAGDAKALAAEIERYARMDPAQREAIGAAARNWLLANRRYRRLAEEYLALALPERKLSSAGSALAPSR
jgi:glycosyltransferase involved in cell wall biosynthesis